MTNYYIDKLVISTMAEILKHIKFHDGEPHVTQPALDHLREVFERLTNGETKDQT